MITNPLYNSKLLQYPKIMKIYSLPPLLNDDSDATVDIGTAKISRAILARIGKVCPLVPPCQNIKIVLIFTHW